jgi:hypothetical protein
LFACSASKMGLTKKRIVMNENYKHIYSIAVPVGDTGISKIYGGHGQGFSINYIDDSFIYYTDDMYVATPNYFNNYTSINFTIPLGGLQSDTTISGQQKDGKYWKEIFHKNYFIGYKNVMENQVSIFDKSLESFKKKR